MGIARRGKRGIFQHFRRVPLRYQYLEPRKIVRTSLHTEDELMAQSKAANIELAQNALWEAMLCGQTGFANSQFDHLQQLAEARGFAYMPAIQVAQLSLNDVLQRVETVESDPTTADAILGAVEAPKHQISDLLEEYESLSQDKLSKNSTEQLHRWRLPRKKAIRNLISVVGDKSIEEFCREDGLKFRTWWWDRITTEQLTANSANKDIHYLSGMINTLIKMKGLCVTCLKWQLLPLNS